MASSVHNGQGGSRVGSSRAMLTILKLCKIAQLALALDVKRGRELTPIFPGHFISKRAEVMKIAARDCLSAEKSSAPRARRDKREDLHTKSQEGRWNGACSLSVHIVRKMWSTPHNLRGENCEIRWEGGVMFD